MARIHHTTIEINQTRLHYAHAGQGPLLLLLHGFPEHWRSWQPQLEALSSTHTVVAPDLRGVNTSSPPGWGYAPDVLLADMVALIDALGFRRATVGGYDTGGMLAWLLAMVFPHRVTRLIAINAPHPALLRHTPPGTRTMREGLRILALALCHLPLLPAWALRARDYALVGHLMRWNSTAPGARPASEVEHYKDAMSTPGAVEAAIETFRAIGSIADIARGEIAADLIRGRMRVAAPTLQIWSHHGATIDTRLNQGITRYVADVETLSVPTCSYRVLHEQPALITSAIGRFLARTDGKGHL